VCYERSVDTKCAMKGGVDTKCATVGGVDTVCYERRCGH
jgi:hypothetical protein